ncbi:MAG: YwiC-like family protein [Anaerolineales bacterium]|nr:YwiC-like family protein [Anaerolineales bacterium]
MAELRSLFVRHVAIPQEHGSWVFLLSPLLIGLFAAERFQPAGWFLIAAAVLVFLLRQPITIMVKVWSGRRPRQELAAASFWLGVYSLLLVGALAGLLLNGQTEVLLLAAPGLPIFAWHLYLVSRRAERRQAGVEILATGALALVAPAALWVGEGQYDPIGWALWLLTWLQAAASIVYAYLRLEQRVLPSVPPLIQRWRMGSRALLYTSFNLLFSLAAGLTSLLPSWIFLPFLLQWLETLWGIQHPAVGVKPTRIGLRQLLVSTLFTIVFIVVWRLG